MNEFSRANTPTATFNLRHVRRWLLIGSAVAYLAVIILVPLAALVSGAFAGGLGAIVAALSEPDVLGAFFRTLLISIIVVLIHAVCGTAVAWVLVRHQFQGQRLLNGLIDLPFAISPVVAGYMLLLLFGRQGLLTPALNTVGISVAFALPGMIIATLFVTLPFMVRELMPVLRAFGVEQEQAAATLGASGWQFLACDLSGIALGLHLRPNADLRAGVGRIRRGAGDWRQHSRPHRNGDRVYLSRTRRPAVRRFLQRRAGAGRAVAAGDFRQRMAAARRTEIAYTVCFIVDFHGAQVDCAPSAWST